MSWSLFFDGWAGPARVLSVSVLAYASLILLLRASGKRTLSKMNAFDSVVTIALGYFADALTGAIGGRARWRTMPWIVIIFGLLVGPLGAISILLVVLQPVMFDAWCTLCLATAVISVLMIGPAMDEFLASLQHLKRERAQGRSPWRVFWGLADRSA